MRIHAFCRVAVLTSFVAVLCSIGLGNSARAEVIAFEAQYHEVPPGPQDSTQGQNPTPQGDDFLIRNTSDFSAQITQVTITLPADTVFDTASGGTAPAFPFTAVSGPTPSSVNVADGGNTLTVEFNRAISTTVMSSFFRST